MNLQAVVILLVIIGVVLLITERLGRIGPRMALVCRKVLHLTGVGGLAVAPLFFTSYWLLAGLVAFFSLILFIAVKRSWLVADLYSRRSLGIALFPLSFLVLWLLFGKTAPHLVMYPMLILAISDAAAAIVGGLLGRINYTVSGDSKSWLGSTAFVMATFLSFLFLPGWLENLHPLFRLELPGIISVADRLIVFAIVALVSAGFEGATSGGWDNVSVPFSVSWMLGVLPWWPHQTLMLALPLLAVLVLFAIFAVRHKWLDTGGAFMAILLGYVIWVAGGWLALALITVFFLTGSLLGKLETRVVSDGKKGKPRDYMQVLCNGGVGGLCMVWYGVTFNPLAWELFVVSVAISNADTWSSEVGIWSGGKVVDIVGFKTLPSGISGGISWQGTLAGLSGACLVALIAGLFGLQHPAWAALGGFTGMLADSLLGSCWQARYRVAGFISDEPPANGKIEVEKGFAWLNNDLVNLLSNLFVTGLAGVLFYFCG